MLEGFFATGTFCLFVLSTTFELSHHIQILHAQITLYHFTVVVVAGDAPKSPPKYRRQ